MEILGHHSDDCVRLASQHERLTYNRAVAAKDSLPKRMTENGQSRPSESIFFWREFAADHWLHAQHTEETRTDALLLHKLGGALSREVHTGRPLGVHRGIQKRSVIANQFPGAPSLRDGVRFPALSFVMDDDSHQAFRLGISKRPEQSCIHDAEDGGVGPYAKRQGEQ